MTEVKRTARPAAAEEESNEGPPPSIAPDSPAEPSESEEEVLEPFEAALAEAQRLREQLLRTAADYDNFRKRTRRDLNEAGVRGRDELLKDLLPVFDNLERAVAHAETATDVKSLAEGIQLVMRQFSDSLGRLGIERVSSLGARFDPAVHEAIQQVETDEYEPGTIAAEVQPGYRAGERLIRPAVVAVAKKPSTPKDEGSE